jgi:formamidopyrimidine-DNA glycosylase
MPEGPEVAYTSEALNYLFKSKKITNISVVAGRYTRTKIGNITKLSDLIKKGYIKLKTTESVGKLLIFHLINTNDNSKWYIFNQFALTGLWTLDQDKYTKVIIEFDDKKLYYSDKLGYGTFSISSNIKDYKQKVLKLSPDLLKSETFKVGHIKNSPKKLVEILMDQHIIGSGIGNYLAAEIMYRSKLSPYRTGKSLSKQDLAVLKYNIKYVIKLAYITNHRKYVSDLKIHVTDMKLKNYHPEIKIKKNDVPILIFRKNVDPKGRKVTKSKIISSRTTFWVEDVQK